MNCNCKDKILIKYLDTYPHELKPALEGDAGIDIYASEDITIGAFETILVPTGLSIQLPIGYEAQVRPKSGLSSKGIQVDFGTIDSGYTGEIKVSMCNLEAQSLRTYVERLTEWKVEVPYFANEEILIKKGQKIAQLVISKVIDTEFIPVEVLDETDRGANGFGSTGV